MCLKWSFYNQKLWRSSKVLTLWRSRWGKGVTYFTSLRLWENYYNSLSHIDIKISSAGCTTKRFPNQYQRVTWKTLHKLQFIIYTVWKSLTMLKGVYIKFGVLTEISLKARPDASDALWKTGSTSLEVKWRHRKPEPFGGWSAYQWPWI